MKLANSLEGPKPALLTVEQAGEVSGLGTRFIRRLVQQRDIVFYKCGRRVMISVEDLATYLESCRRESEAASRR